ncbi:MAG TPA: hypothetical protein VHC90_10215 [Bryobacteraceae bacterium]|nr:hypothetical protein [Bryobacteraceae bacterium]
MNALLACWVLVVAAGSVDAQVVLSRRDYAEHGRTFAQIWMADAGGLNFRQLTHSARDHSEPVCSRDGRVIYFVSDPDIERSRNSYGERPNEREVWSYDRKTGEERLIWRTPGDSAVDLSGINLDNELLVRAGTELRSLGRNPWSIDNVDDAEVSPGGHRVALVIAQSYDKDGQSQNARLFTVDAETGRSRIELGQYALPAWSPDGARIAAFFDEGLAILDAANGVEIEQIELPRRDAPSQDIVWSPHGRRLLAGLYGENGGAGDPQNDYLLLNAGAGTWEPELTARRLLWMGDDRILYLRPYATTPLAAGSPHEVWTSQLAVYDLVSHKDTGLTSGAVLVNSLAECGF